MEPPRPGRGATIDYTGANLFTIGASTVPGSYFSGSIDEVRVMNVEASTSWVTSEYNNQSSPGTFLTLGSEAAVGGGTVKKLTLLGVG